MPWPLGGIIARERSILVEVKWPDSLAGWASDMLEALRDAATIGQGSSL